MLNVQGPASRALLQKLGDTDLRTPFSVWEARELRIADAKVLALRITYVGELGWEPICRQTHEVFDALVTAG